jgi:hypothetical protein
MPLTRRQVIAGTAAAALAGGGVYELVDRLTGGSGRPAAVTAARREQHLLDGLRVVRSNDIEVVVPPLHMQVVTLELTAGESRAELRAARAALEDAVAAVERRYAPTPAGIGVTLAWGLPYFDRLVPDLARTHIPVDRRASKAAGSEIRALVDAIRFPSDPDATVLERNDAALLLRSDSLDRIADASRTLVNELDLWRPTSIRRGFAGGGFDGATALPRRMALAAGVPGAQLIPEQAELFLGFTSTQKAGLGPGRIANLETLGYSDGGPGGYFTGGTTMHLSHIFEDLEAWYLGLDFNQRVATLFRPGQKTPPGTLTVRQGPDDVATIAANRRDYERFRGIGHSAAIQTASRLREDVRGTDGTLYRAGTAVPQRADANTLDNPFFWSAQPDADGMASGAAAGVHFVVFHPTSDDFARTRRAMDGAFPDGTRVPLERGDPGQGINSVLTTTHRQSFLVPPRPHRALPLVDLIT